MEISDFYSLYSNLYTAEKQRFFANKGSVGVSSTMLAGLNTSARALLLTALKSDTSATFIAVCDDEDEAVYLFNDIEKISTKKTFYFPRSKKYDAASVILQTELLNQLSESKDVFIVTTCEALCSYVPTAKNLAGNTIVISENEQVEVDFLVESFRNGGFQQVDYVYAPGQFSLRGSIIDIFSYSSDYPFRIDMFGNEIESIRTFDIERQLSLEAVKSVTIVSKFELQNGDNRCLLFEYFDKCNTYFFTNKLDFSLAQFDEFELKEGSELSIFEHYLSQYYLCELRSNAQNETTVNLSPQPLFHKNFDLVAQSLLKLQAEGYQIFIASDSIKQTDRLSSIFSERGDAIHFTPVHGTLHEGFIDVAKKVCCFTDHQIFERFHKYQLKTERLRSGKSAMMLKELNLLQIGDYVVHIDHGIGKFGGLQKIDLNGKEQEVIKLIYKNDDIIFVSIHGLHRIAKYRGKDGVEPQLSKLGSGAWERMKDRTKKKIKDIARDLIKLYAQRLREKGFAYSPDSYLQQELEASFLYEDTPDQQKVTLEVKQDMERAIPMDRLVCGDVGFGKTEVAVRAAFKAVCDNKQVAVLVPTTILALQHYKTFKQRLKNFPCRVEYISRMRKPAEVKQVIAATASGDVDILIGTHRLIGKDVKFNDLGLLIIDEEQKFGVSVKEKLKQLKVNVDTLTLTATPIPRTLQFSLMGARDLSVMTTPPPNRHPIATELHCYSEEVIKEAIERELSRNGQVFFLHNRVQSLERIKMMLTNLIPSLRVAIAHGQMAPDELEHTLLDFIEYDYDVLIATTVIESGIDIPNVNTIIINNAQSFGLTDLHQLRGRVGRGNRKAYCYLLAPPFKELTDDGRRRLQAIENFSDLGSGFNIAMQDLDIRGAGNMLGAEQSGFIADVGYETYQKILEEAVEELHLEEFSDLPNSNTNKEMVSDCAIESDMELLFPETYIENVAERISLYRELDNISTEQQLTTFQSNLKDRFGTMPLQVNDLIQMVRVRWMAKALGIERLILKQEQMMLYFVSNRDSYFQSEAFGNILQFIATHPHICRLSEKNSKRSVVIQRITDIDTALACLQQIKGE